MVQSCIQCNRALLYILRGIMASFTMADIMIGAMEVINMTRQRSSDLAHASKNGGLFMLSICLFISYCGAR